MKKMLCAAMLFVPLFNYGMEVDPERVLKEALQQREESKNANKEENFGDHNNEVVAAPEALKGDVAVDIDKLNSEKKEKKEKKAKKEKRSKKNKSVEALQQGQSDRVGNDLADLEAGINPEDIDARIIAQLKIFRGDITEQQEEELREHIVTMRKDAPEKYNELKTTMQPQNIQATRGLFGLTQQNVTVGGAALVKLIPGAIEALGKMTAKTEQDSSELSALVNALNNATKQQAAADKLFAEIDQERNALMKQQIEKMEEANKGQAEQITTLNGQLTAMNITNANMSKGYKLTRKLGIGGLACSGIGVAISIISLGIASGAFAN